MENLLIQIFAIVIGTVILSWFGLGGNHSTITINTGDVRAKKWKILIVIGIGMIISGVVLFGNNFQNGGWENPYSGTGFSLGFFGLIIFYMGKFGNWWSK